MPYTTAGKAAMLAALGASHVALHVGAPGDNGANEIGAGAYPTYARQPISWGAIAAGSRPASSQPQFASIPSGVTITHISYWTALTGGSCVMTDDIPDESYASTGSLTITSAAYNLNA